MNKAFTMIEVVFVIVIIGILAAVALPRFVNIAEDAHLSKVRLFVDTLNRTTGPVIWSALQRKYPNVKGSVKALTERQYQVIFDEETTSVVDAPNAQMQSIPTEITTNPDGTTGQGTTHDIPLAGCENTGTLVALGVGYIAYAKINGTVYHMGCIDGSLSASPHFFLDNGTNVLTR